MHDGSQNLSRTRLVDKDMSGRFTSLSKERNLAEPYFHQPFERVSQETINQEDVKSTLMVGYEYIRSVFLDIWVTLYLYWKEEGITEDIRPNFARPVTPEMSVANATTDDDGGAHDNG
jgi:hypothetical protein